MSEVSEFYDEFTTLQVKAGINHRHLSIIYHLEEAGLKRNHKVLEVGCGIGTVSELILRYLSPEGFLRSVDISPKSIQLANARLGKYSNKRVDVLDLCKEAENEKYHVIVLPDVIEHIPWDLHTALFSNLRKMLADNGFIFIHIPHPNNLEWMVNNKYEGLQIIDQPIFTDKLCSIVYPLNFFIHMMKSYAIYGVDDDYQIIILKQKPATQNTDDRSTFFMTPFSDRIFKKLRFLLRGFK